MKDIVENRHRIDGLSKIRLVSLLVRENGILWFSYMMLYYLCSGISNFAFARTDILRKKNNLPGLNSRSANKFIWEHWDWSALGDEWTPSSEWKASVVKTFVEPYFKGGAILEIGPGAGRWTEYLVPGADHFIGIDISETCVRECQTRFANCRNAAFKIGNGRDLRMIGDNSIDRVWSFDVFVHINREEFESYIGELARILRAGGIGAIHHGSSGGSDGGWRSNATTAQVREYLAKNHFQVVDQIQSWSDNGKEYQIGLYADVLTTFRKPQ